MPPKKEDKAHLTHSTQIGSVTGQVHSGSGDIIVKSFSAGDSISHKADFLTALKQFKEELEAARQKGLDEDLADDTLNEINAVEQEAKKEDPKPDRIIKRLKQAQEVLAAGAGVATVAKSTVTAINSLLPHLQNAIQIVNRIF
jgi:hypothetical protein